MSKQALDLANKIIKKRYVGQKAIEEGFRPVKDASSFGLQSKSALESANAFFSDANAKEKELTDKRDELLKSLNKTIPWGYYEKKISNQEFVTKSRKAFEDIFNGSIAEEAINKTESYKEKAKEIPQETRDFMAQIERRQQQLEETAENEINPLLNPFSDFWLYGKDGPEFHEVFAARPQWNEYINTAADDYAFHFPVNNDATRRPELMEAYQSGIGAKLNEFEDEYSARLGLEVTRGKKDGKSTEIVKASEMSSEAALQAIADIANGKLSNEMLNYYEENYNAANEQALLLEYTYGDNNSIAMRTPWVSGEADPQAKHFGGH